MHLFISFNKEIRKYNPFWKAWCFLLVAFNLFLPLIFIQHPEAQAVIGASLLAMATMLMLYKKFGFVRLLGIAHIFWIPVLIWLSERIELVQWNSPFALWMALVVLFDCLSLLVDTVDIFRYIQGERSPIFKE